MLLLLVLSLLFSLIAGGLFLYPEAIFPFIMILIGFIFSILKVKGLLQTAYFFDEVCFLPNEIELTKNKEIHTLDFKPPYLIDLVVDQSEKRTRIDLEYFGQRLLTFQIEKIEDLPILTDGLCDLYNLDLVDFFEFDEQEQMLDFYSKEDKSIATFIDIDDNEDFLKVDLSLDKTKLRFDWFKNNLIIENETIVEELAIDEVEDITWYFETEDKDITCYLYILDQQKDYSFEQPILSQKSKETVFQTALQFIKILKSKEILNDREIGISSRYLD